MPPRIQTHAIVETRNEWVGYPTPSRFYLQRMRREALATIHRSLKKANIGQRSQGPSRHVRMHGSIVKLFSGGPGPGAFGRNGIRP